WPPSSPISWTGPQPSIPRRIASRSRRSFADGGPRSGSATPSRRDVLAADCRGISPTISAHVTLVARPCSGRGPSPYEKNLRVDADGANNERANLARLACPIAIRPCSAAQRCRNAHIAAIRHGEPVPSLFPNEIGRVGGERRTRDLGT